MKLLNAGRITKSFSCDADQRFDTKSNARLGGHQFGSNSPLPLYGAKLQSNACGDGRFWHWLTLTSRLFPWYSTRDFEQILTYRYLGLKEQHFAKEIGFLTFNRLMAVWRTRSTFAGIGFTIWSSLHIQQTLVQQISQTIRLEISLCCDIHNNLVLGEYRLPLWRWPEDRVSSTSCTILIPGSNVAEIKSSESWRLRSFWGPSVKGTADFFKGASQF